MSAIVIPVEEVFKKEDNNDKMYLSCYKVETVSNVIPTVLSTLMSGYVASDGIIERDDMACKQMGLFKKRGDTEPYEFRIVTDGFQKYHPEYVGYWVAKEYEAVKTNVRFGLDTMTCFPYNFSQIGGPLTPLPIHEVNGKTEFNCGSMRYPLLWWIMTSGGHVTLTDESTTVEVAPKLGYLFSENIKTFFNIHCDLAYVMLSHFKIRFEDEANKEGADMYSTDNLWHFIQCEQYTGPKYYPYSYDAQIDPGFGLRQEELKIENLCKDLRLFEATKSYAQLLARRIMFLVQQHGEKVLTLLVVCLVRQYAAQRFMHISANHKFGIIDYQFNGNKLMRTVKTGAYEFSELLNKTTIVEIVSRAMRMVYSKIAITNAEFICKVDDSKNSEHYEHAYGSFATYYSEKYHDDTEWTKLHSIYDSKLNRVPSLVNLALVKAVFTNFHGFEDFLHTVNYFDTVLGGMCSMLSKDVLLTNKSLQGCGVSICSANTFFASEYLGYRNRYMIGAYDRDLAYESVWSSNCGNDEYWYVGCEGMYEATDDFRCEGSMLWSNLPPCAAAVLLWIPPDMLTKEFIAHEIYRIMELNGISSDEAFVMFTSSYLWNMLHWNRYDAIIPVGNDKIRSRGIALVSELVQRCNENVRFSDHVKHDAVDRYFLPHVGAKTKQGLYLFNYGFSYDSFDAVRDLEPLGSFRLRDDVLQDLKKGNYNKKRRLEEDDANEE